MLNTKITNITSSETIGPSEPTRLPTPFQWILLRPGESKTIPCTVADLESRAFYTGYSCAEYLHQLVQSGKITVEFEEIQDFTDIPDLPYQYVTDGSGPAPVSFDISSFAFAGGTPSIVELGSTVTNPTFSASYIGTPSAATLDDGTGAVDLTTPFTSFGLGRTYTKSAVGSSQPFTLWATDGTTEANRTISINWWPMVYYGVAAVPGAYDQTFVLTTIAPQGSVLAGSRQRTVSYDAAPGQKLFYIYPDTFGGVPANFRDANTGWEAGFSKSATVAVTNSFGVTVSYAVWESDQTGLGLVSIQIT